MSDIGTIPEMFTRFTDIVNRFKALASNVPNIEFVDKILCSLPKSWEPKVTSILESKDLATLKLGQLIGS